MIGDEKPNNNLLIDSVYVRPPLPYPDVGVSKILLPDTADFNDTLQPKVWVKNFGNLPVSFPVIFRINSVYTDTCLVDSLFPNDSLLLSFRSWLLKLELI